MIASASSPWPQASWKEDAARPASQDDGQFSRRRGARVQLGDGLSSRAARRLRDRLGREDLESTRAGDRPIAGLHAAVAHGHARHVEASAHLMILGEDAIGVGDHKIPGRITERHLHLTDG
jgi:hypothetical protein